MFTVVVRALARVIRWVGAKCEADDPGSTSILVVFALRFSLGNTKEAPHRKLSEMKKAL